MAVHESRFYFPAPRQAHDEELCVNRMAADEPMVKGLVDRPSVGDYLFLLLPDGGELIDAHGVQQSKQPMLIYWKPQQRHHYGNARKKWLHTWMHVSGTALKRIEHICPSNTAIILPDAERVAAQFELVYQELQDPRPLSKIISNAIESLLYMAQRYVDPADEAEIPAAFMKIKQYMDTNAQLPLSLDELAKKVALSASHFSNRFRHYFQCSPIDYLIRVRMEQAGRMLSNENVQISDVSRAVGYDDVAYFSRLVKRYYGVNPRQLRKQLLEL